MNTIKEDTQERGASAVDIETTENGSDEPNRLAIDLLRMKRQKKRSIFAHLFLIELTASQETARTVYGRLSNRNSNQNLQEK